MGTRPSYRIYDCCICGEDSRAYGAREPKPTYPYCHTHLIIAFRQEVLDALTELGKPSTFVDVQHHIHTPFSFTVQAALGWLHQNGFVDVQGNLWSVV